MRVYLAMPWKDREKAPEIAKALETVGHTITWKWWGVSEVGESEEARSVETLREQATNDVRGVLRADVVIVVNSAKSEGKATEQGVAIADRKPILIVGKRGEHSANVFHYLPNVKFFDTIEQIIEFLAPIQWLTEQGDYREV